MDVTRLEVDGKKLQEARGDRSPGKIAARLGISRNQLWNIENGKSKPSADVLVRLCALYKRDISEFTVETAAA
jgi:transcriptional regulator with XRE-family HTH domain